MGNIGTTYGVLPSDLASAQALSLFNSQVSATYYNPAYLAQDDRGELTTGLLHAGPKLRATGVGGAAPLPRRLRALRRIRLYRQGTAARVTLWLAALLGRL